MILVAGGTGRAGREIVRLLLARGFPVRVLTREPSRGRLLALQGAQVVAGDVRDREAVGAAMEGVHTVISAVHGFAGPGATSPTAVDWRGNLNLVQSASLHDAEHMIILSAHGAAPDHPMELYRMKHRAEEALKASGMAWTILRATAFMETWATLVGQPLLTTGRTTIFGRGRNPINFVSAHDVARFAELAVMDSTLRGKVVEVGGPENLTFEQVVSIFERESGRQGTTTHIPRAMMRAMSLLLRPIKPGMARQIQAGVVMDTVDMTCDGSARACRYPSVPLTTLAGVVRRDHLQA